MVEFSTFIAQLPFGWAFGVLPALRGIVRIAIAPATGVFFLGRVRGTAVVPPIPLVL